MYEYIANLFYFGFRKPLIEALKQLTKICDGQYRMGIQTKLMNTIYIILTLKIEYFPVDSLLNHYKKNQQQRQKDMKKKLAEGKAEGMNQSLLSGAGDDMQINSSNRGSEMMDPKYAE